MLRPIVLFRQCRRKTQSRIKTDTSVFRGGSGNSKRETSFGCSIGRGGFVETRHFVAEHTQVYREMVCGDEVGFVGNVALATYGEAARGAQIVSAICKREEFVQTRSSEQQTSERGDAR